MKRIETVASNVSGGMIDVGLLVHVAKRKNTPQTHPIDSYRWANNSSFLCISMIPSANQTWLAGKSTVEFGDFPS